MDKCNCNCALREHLKECCGYGQLPKLIDTCDPPKKTSQDCGPKADPCSFKTPDLTCGAPQPQFTACSDNTGPKSKCPPMPPTALGGCIPTWLCPPAKSGVPTYPAPSGVIIQPISVGGRKRDGAGGAGRCGACGSGTDSGSKRAAPKVSKDCPMVRPRCGKKAEQEPKQGFFAKILSFFGIGKKN